jgi:hypothetical protein
VDINMDIWVIHPVNQPKKEKFMADGKMMT